MPKASTAVRIYDLWHRAHPSKGATPCRCSRGKVKLYPSALHEKGMRWQVRYEDDEGKGVRRNFEEREGENPELHAEAFAAETRTGLAAKTYTSPALAKITLQEYAEQWRSGLTAKPRTLRTIEDRLAHIIYVEPRSGQRKSRRYGEPGSSIADKPLSLLLKRPSLLQQWIKSLEAKGLSDQYAKHITATLSSIFIAAIDDGIVARNPMLAKSVRPPKPERKKVVPWTLEQVQAAAASLAEANERIGLMAELGAGAGMRQGEICALAEEDIEFLGGRVIHVQRQIQVMDGVPVFCLPKGRKTRDVPLSDALGLVISDHIRRFPSVEITLPWEKPDGPMHTAQLLFVRKDGKPYARRDFGLIWQTAREAAGVPVTRENGMHVLRHTFASACLAHGVDIRTLAEYLGHEDPGFTLRVYAHLMPGSDDRARRALNAFFEGTGEDASALRMPSGAE